MNRILLLIAVAVFTFLAIYFLSQPELLKNFWLWLVGFAGLIVKGIEICITKVKSFFPKAEQSNANKLTQNKELVNEQ